MNFISLVEISTLRKHISYQNFILAKDIYTSATNTYSTHYRVYNSGCDTPLAIIFNAGRIVGKREERYKNKHGKRALKSFLRL